MAPKADAKAKPKKEPKAEGEEEAKKVPQPDRDAFDAAVGAKNTEVEKLQKQLQDLQKKIGEKSTGKDEFFSKKNEIRRKIDEFQSQIDKIVEQKDKLAKQLGEQNQKQKEMRSQLNDAKKKMHYDSEEAIDEEIANIEFKMWTSSLSLKEEKAALQQITDLKKMKPKLTSLGKMKDALDSGSAQQAALPVREQMDLLSSQMREIRDEKKKEQEAYGKLMELRKKQMADMPELFEKREELNAQIGEIIRQRNEIRNDFRAKEKEYNAYLAEQRAIRAEKGRAERERRQAEWEARKKERDAEKAEEQPFLAEITLLEQTILWCKAQLPQEEKKKVEENKINFNNPEGSMVLLKKNDREEEYFYAPTKVKGLKQKGKKEEKKNIKHNVETFRLFDALKLDAPITVSDVPPVLEKLEAQLADYQAKVKVWEKDRAEGKNKKEEAAADEEEKKEDESKEEA